MKVLRKIIEIDEERCDGCGQCVPACAEGALQVVDGKVKVIADKLCDGLGACLGECPNDALRVIERKAEEFDEEAVEEMLVQQANSAPQDRAPLFTGGCPSAAVHLFVPKESCDEANVPRPQDTPAGLSHWPIQIRLVPSTAPFLKGADLLVVADCVPPAYPRFHSDFVKGKVVLMGCPKFDDVPSYIEKFTEIFKTAGIRKITCVTMEVPCCSGLPVIVQKALAAARVQIPMEEAVITRRGERMAEAS